MFCGREIWGLIAPRYRRRYAFEVKDEKNQ